MYAPAHKRAFLFSAPVRKETEQRRKKYAASSPHARGSHDAVKLIDEHAPGHACAPVRLENHILEHLVVHVLLEHGRDAPQVRERDGPRLPVGEEAVGLVDLGAVGLGAGLAAGAAVAAGVELEGADGEEGLVRGEAVAVGVEDVGELLELCLRRGRDAQCSV